MKSLYYQFVNFVQSINVYLFLACWLIMFVFILLNIMKFFKAYNGTQKKFEKMGTFTLALILFALLVFFTYIRN